MLTSPHSFTIFTIIFVSPKGLSLTRRSGGDAEMILTSLQLPLSFFTSLFGMNASEWTGSSSDPNLHVIFLWTFPVSIVVIITALFVAFNSYVRHRAVWALKLASKMTGRSRGPRDLEHGAAGGPIGRAIGAVGGAGAAIAVADIDIYALGRRMHKKSE